MRKSISIIGLSIICLLLAECTNSVPTITSDKVDQSRVFQTYKVIYREYSGNLNAQAAFHLDNTSGKIVKLNDHSKVSFEKNDMKWQEKGFYEEESNTWIARPTFKYVNNDGQSFTNRLTINKIEFKQNHIVLRKDAVNSFPCNGKPLGVNERIYLVLHIGGEEVEVPAELNKKNIEPDVNALSDIPAGTYTGCLARKNFNTNVNALDRGGVWESEYYSNRQPITIQ